MNFENYVVDVQRIVLEFFLRKVDRFKIFRILNEVEYMIILFSIEFIFYFIWGFCLIYYIRLFERYQFD